MASKGTQQIRIGRVKRLVVTWVYWRDVYLVNGDTIRAGMVDAILGTLVEEFGEDVLPPEREGGE